MIRAAFLAWLMLASFAALASSPEWARPYIKAEAPHGDYIRQDEPWVLMYHDEEVQSLPNGGLVRQYREVYVLEGKIARSLTIAVPYDQETQRLTPPEVWVPGVFGYKQLNMKKSSLDLPNSGSGLITSGREVFVSTTYIEPQSKAAVTWAVSDSEAWPGQDIVFPFGAYPCAKWRLHGDGALPLSIALVDPRKNPAEIKHGEVGLANLPSYSSVKLSGDPWAPDTMEYLPYLVVTANSAVEREWRETAAGAAKLFVGAWSPKASVEASKKAAVLTKGVQSNLEKACKIASFVQGLAYRNIAWGTGAFVPESPDETLRTLSADCKGKVALMHALLGAQGIKSVPVLCRAGEPYLNDIPIPTPLPFDHVVIAVDLGDQAAMPASLGSGPGKGWILFDPTDSIATFGLTDGALAGTWGLWLGEEDGGLFKIEFGPEASLFSAKMEVDISEEERAAFTLTISGEGGLLTQIAGNGELNSSSRQLAEESLKYYGWAVSGLTVDDARFLPGDGLASRPAAMVVTGHMEHPFQIVTKDTRLLVPVMPLLGRALGLPRDGYSRKDERSDSGRKAAEGYLPDGSYENAERSMRVVLLIKLPPGITVNAYPGLRNSISEKWLEAAVSSGREWVLDAKFHRGRFKGGAESARLSGLNALCAIFRQPIMVSANGK